MTRCLTGMPRVYMLHQDIDPACAQCSYRCLSSAYAVGCLVGLTDQEHAVDKALSAACGAMHLHINFDRMQDPLQDPAAKSLQSMVLATACALDCRLAS